MPEPDFVLLLVDQAAEPLIAAGYEDGRLNPALGASPLRFERLVRRLPPSFEPEEVVKVPAFLIDRQTATRPP